MNRLVSIIGKAPSELLPEEFRKRLIGERDRARHCMELWRQSKAGKRAARGPSQTKKQKAMRGAIASALEKKGLSVNQALAMLEKAGGPDGKG